jgi:Tat protein secretion system quality control protein TatD with DNase activity
MVAFFSNSFPPNKISYDTDRIMETTAPSFIDSHAHIQRIFLKDKIEIGKYPEYLKNTISAVAEKNNTKYEGCVNVCCGSQYYDDGEKLAAYDGIYPAWGVHPHR